MTSRPAVRTARPEGTPTASPEIAGGPADLPSWPAIAAYLGRQAQDAMSLDGLSRAFKPIVASLGIDAFACGRMHLHDRKLATFLIIDWPERWRQFYVKSGLLDRDPLLDHLHETTDVFTWSELRRSRRMTKAGSEAIALAAEHGWTEGIVVPVDVSPPFVGLVSLVARRAAFSVDEKAFLTLASSHLYQRAKDVALMSGLAAAPASLTAREIACLQQVARGCSDRQVGEALKISTATAHEYVESAKRKLNASTRSTAVATAISLLVIRPQ